MTFGERVKNLRKWRDMTQEELADRSGLGLGQISKIERGDNKDPKLSTIEKLVNGLRVSADKLIESKVDEGLTGILKAKLETLNRLPSQDIRTVVRMIDNFSFEERIRNAMVDIEPTEFDLYENEIFQTEIEKREEEEDLEAKYQVNEKF